MGSNGSVPHLYSIIVNIHHLFPSLSLQTPGLLFCFLSSVMSTCNFLHLQLSLVWSCFNIHILSLLPSLTSCHHFTFIPLLSLFHSSWTPLSSPFCTLSRYALFVHECMMCLLLRMRCRLLCHHPTRSVIKTTAKSEQQKFGQEQNHPQPPNMPIEVGSTPSSSNLDQMVGGTWGYMCHGATCIMGLHVSWG